LVHGFTLSLLFALLAIPAFAQTLGEITGHVSDSSGASIPAATILLTNKSTNAVRSPVEVLDMVGEHNTSDTLACRERHLERITLPLAGYGAGQRKPRFGVVLAR
jgi:hypothetical protein